MDRSRVILFLALALLLGTALPAFAKLKKVAKKVAAPPVAGDFDVYRGKKYNVSWDERAFTVNGARLLVLSGSVHYPRSTPEMWPGIMAKMKAAGLNTVETYVFWSLHEPVRRQYDFETDRLNLPYFLQCASDAGLFVVLRIGPYVCAEFNYGGLPVWLRPTGMTVRTMDDQWLAEMKTFTAKVLDVVEPYMPRNGGPIIIAQIENEYGNIEGSYGKNGTLYVQWCAQTALSLDSDPAWIMCQQDDAPTTTVNTCNGFYCDSWLSGHFSSRHQPGFHTENWGGWFQSWGSPFPVRPTEDVAFSVARFIQRGGTASNYYMYHGGTNFGRSVANYITTSYDYDVQLNEYGLPHEPKYSHTARMHQVMRQYAAAILQNPVPTPTTTGSELEVHAYGNLVFVGSWHTSNQTITYQNVQLLVPAWSVTLYDWSNPSSPVKLYSTAEVGAVPTPVVKQTNVPLDELEYAPDAIGGCAQCKTTSHSGPLEQTAVTGDYTDYLWYTASVTADAGSIPLSLAFAQNYVYVFLDSKLAYSGRGWDSSRTVTITVPTSGQHKLQILTMSMGLPNYGAFYDNVKQGLQTPIKFNNVDLSAANWTHVSGLLGELKEYFTPAGAEAAPWQPYSSSAVAPFTWYSAYAHLDAIDPESTYTLDLASMGKGAAYVNGHHIGRYWSVIASGSCNPCDYRGSFQNNCYTGCGEPSQRYYHVPRDWLVEGDNLIVFFEETTSAKPESVTLRVQHYQY